MADEHQRAPSKKESARSGQQRQTTTQQGQFHASIEWSTNPTTHLLRLHLPGFKKEDLKVVVDDAGKLTVRGRRAEAAAPPLRLEQSFAVPADSDTERITGRFEGDHLTVVMPRMPAGPERPPPAAWSNVPFLEDGAAEAPPRPPEEQEGGRWEKIEIEAAAGEPAIERRRRQACCRLVDEVKRWRGAVAVAVAAFALGFYVSHRMRTRA